MASFTKTTEYKTAIYEELKKGKEDRNYDIIHFLEKEIEALKEIEDKEIERKEKIHLKIELELMKPPADQNDALLKHFYHQLGIKRTSSKINNIY